MEPMESPNFLEHAELLDENTPHYLNAFHKYLIQHNMSPNTITAYIYSVRHFFTYFGQLNSNNVSLYKVYLLDHYQPQTVNMRIRALKTRPPASAEKIYGLHHKPGRLRIPEAQTPRG